MIMTSKDEISDRFHLVLELCHGIINFSRLLVKVRCYAFHEDNAAACKTLIQAKHFGWCQCGQQTTVLKPNKEENFYNSEKGNPGEKKPKSILEELEEGIYNLKDNHNECKKTQRLPNMSAMLCRRSCFQNERL